jgi:hypothetical protein
MIVNDKSPASVFNNSTAESATTSLDVYSAKMKKRKMIILGKMGAGNKFYKIYSIGKSSIIKRFVDNSLPEKAQVTLEETSTKNYFYKNEELKLVLLDTPGQSEYTPALPNRYCIGNYIIIIIRSTWLYIIILY